jgi:hypothetical protein
LVELLRNLAKLALPLRAEAAESNFPHPVCDSSYQQLAAEMRGCIGFEERAPALTKLAEIELGEARKRLPASRCIFDREQRREGATVDEVASATGWQRHTVRGVFSGTSKKKLGLILASAAEERGRVYRIAAPERA